MHEGIDSRTEAVSRQIVDAGIKVHRTLGPGLLESVYEHCLASELNRRGAAVRRQCPVPIVYEGEVLQMSLRLDLLVDERVIVEVKALEALLPIHSAQLLTYLKLSGLRLGLLMNFNTVLLKDGLRRVAL